MSLNTLDYLLLVSGMYLRKVSWIACLLVEFLPMLNPWYLLLLLKLCS